MKRVLGYTLLGLVAYLVFMVLQSPAAVLFGFLGQHIPGLALQDIEGSALHGSARGLRVQNTEFQSLSWQWRPLALLGGRIEYRFVAEDAALALSGDIGMNWDRQLALSDLDGRLPLSRALTLLGRPPIPLNAYLELNLDSVRLSEDGRLRAAQGVVRLIDARTTLGEPQELGDFGIELTTTEQGILGTVTDSNGPVGLTGNLTLTPDNRYRLVGEITARDKNNRHLQQLLGMLGQPSGDGVWKVDFTGTL